jgi:hypothetical protein
VQELLDARSKERCARKVDLPDRIQDGPVTFLTAVETKFDRWDSLKTKARSGDRRIV